MLPALLSLVCLSNSNAKSIDERVKLVLPTADEQKWQQIPWRTNLMAARAEAQKVGKPIFLWIMVGNPQGCT